MLELFTFEMNPWELVLRGTAMYWFLYLLFRFVLRRDVGSLGIADVLLLVLIADASQSAMAGGYTTVAEGCVLVATIAGWNYLLDWCSYRYDFVRRLTDPPPLLLIRHGRVMRANLRREMLSLDDLRAQLREHGVGDLADVRSAFMESDGNISVIRNRPDDSADAAPHRHRRPMG
jgi:uncharacterized membrane protein YcaP (DUF421 family)